MLPVYTNCGASTNAVSSSLLQLVMNGICDHCPLVSISNPGSGYTPPSPLKRVLLRREHQDRHAHGSHELAHVEWHMLETCKCVAPRVRRALRRGCNKRLPSGLLHACVGRPYEPNSRI
jgi:hypothetical protein